MRVDFLSELDLREVHEGIWMYLNPFYTLITLDDGTKVEMIIPGGFVTDLCSVPRMPFAYLLFGGKGNKAGGVHDALYSPFKGISVVDIHSREPVEVTREWADAVLYAALEACGVGWQAWWMYKGVRMFGWQFYKREG